MIGKLVRGALRGIKAELATGESGWIAVDQDGATVSSFGTMTSSGAMVSAQSALQLSAVWAATTRTAQLVSTLPVKLMEKRPNGDRVPVDDPLQDMLTQRPNQMQTAPEYLEAKIAAQLLQGNAYSEKLMIGNRVVGLRPLGSVSPIRRADGRFDYRFADRGKTEVLPPEKVFHIRGFGFGDGLGLSVVKYGAQGIGAALSADEVASSFFGNALTPSGFLQTDQTLDEAQRAQLGEYLRAYAGSKRAGKTMVLEHGLTYNPVSINPEDAQLLQTRRFQVEEICRWFGIPPIVVGHAAEGQTMWGSGVESIMLSWLTTGINPLLRRLEARLNTDLVPAANRGKWYFEFNREAMLQMDSKAKAEFLSKMITTGTLSRNEAREKLNYPRHADPAADALMAQTALAPIDTLGKEST